MRKLASFSDHASAHAASDALDAVDIANELRIELDRSHAVWVLIESQVAEARRVLAELAARAGAAPSRAASVAPAPSAIPAAAAPSAATRPVEAARPRAAQPGVATQRVSALSALRAKVRGAPVTGSLILICTALSIASALGHEAWLQHNLFIASRMPGHDYDDLMAGQLWRLVTPALLHAGALHLIFNLLWLLELGAAIERVVGTLRFTSFLIFSAVVSNLAQLHFGGSPAFCGLSGLVYACIGYLWSRGRFDPTSPIGAPLQLVTFFVIWLVLGFTGALSGMVGPIANYCHLGGLVAGAACGYLSALANKRRSAQH